MTPTDDNEIHQGDRVTLVQDFDTTRGWHIAGGSVGTVAEDRGSRLVVFFDEQNDEAASLDGTQLRRVQD